MADMRSDDVDVRFRKITEPDLPVMKQWLDDPDVSPWYGSDSTTPEALREKYGSRIRGEDTTHGFIITVDGRDAGYIQCYVIDDEPDYARQVQVEPGAVGIDLFIGEPEFRNRGLGAVVIRALLEQVVFGEMDALVAIIAPEPGNARAIRAYEKVGFVWQRTVHIVDESPANMGDEYVMRLTREDYEARA